MTPISRSAHLGRHIGLWCLAAVLMVAFVGSIVLAVWAAMTAPAAGEFWGTRTGPVGDTFGGLLGPILNAAVLAATVYLAVTWQPRKEERDRAADVVAWVAETDAGHLGVVVTNASGSVADFVDIRVERNDTRSDGALTDCERAIPPGSWFVPFRVEGDAPEIGWRLPVSVDATSGMTVDLTTPAAATADGSAASAAQASSTYSLRPHLPEVAGTEQLPHYAVTRLRYDLHGKSWLRESDGSIHRAPTLTPDETAERDRGLRTTRRSAQPRGLSRRVTPDVEQLLRFTIDVLCGETAADGADVFADAAQTPQPATQRIIPAVTAVSRQSANGGTIRLHLGDDRRIVMFQAKEKFPGQILIQNAAGEDLRLGEKLLSASAKKAGAAILGRRHAYELPQDAAEWMRTATSRALWIKALTAIVEAAAVEAETSVVELEVTP